MKKHLLTTICILLSIAEISGQDSFIKTRLKAGELTWQGDLSGQMVMQIDSFLTLKTRETKAKRESEWASKSKASPAEWQAFADSTRQQLKKIWGMTGEREKPAIAIATHPETRQQIVSVAEEVRIYPVKWRVAGQLEMIGLLLQPEQPVRARMVIVPDADQAPEQLAGITPDENGYPTALTLARQGIQVLIPALISRKQELSGSKALNIYTNQPHREWIYRQAFNLGRHIIGYELQRIASCIDWLELQNQLDGKTTTPIAIAGYGEGGMLALYTTAIDRRVSAALVSGYAGNTEDLWKEPIYRNLHGNLNVAGNAELLALSAHAEIVVEYAEAPAVTDPALIEGRRGGAAPGRLSTPPAANVKQETDLARQYRNGLNIRLISDNGAAFKRPFAPATLEAMTGALKLSFAASALPAAPRPASWVDTGQREKQLFGQLETIIQQELDICEITRNQTFWKEVSHRPGEDIPTKKRQREFLHQTIGKIGDPLIAPSPRARLLETTTAWRKYEVVLDVWDGVFAWGILVVPVSVDNGSPHPVVVCQHGLEGLPNDLVVRDTTERKFKVYKAMALSLAERGFITFSPHNPYRGEDKFRVLQRKANPIGLSLFSVITGQHQQIVNWLGGLSFVDKNRIGFYGLSYGGKTAMRIPALVEGYALSICSGDFNEWIRKVASTRLSYSYQVTKEYEIYEWDLGHRFNYAEMAALIAPRPFMVEYGYKDGIGSAEWISYELGKVRKHYDLSGLSDLLDIDLFNGFHEINAVKTYPFLDKHLKN